MYIVSVIFIYIKDQERLFTFYKLLVTLNRRLALKAYIGDDKDKKSAKMDASSEDKTGNHCRPRLKHVSNLTSFAPIDFWT